MKRASIVLLALGIALGSAGAPESGRLHVATSASPAHQATHEATTAAGDFRGAGFWRDLFACGGCIVGSVLATLVTVVGGIVVGSACAMVCLS